MASVHWSQAPARRRTRDRPHPGATQRGGVAVNDFVMERAEAVAAEIESLVYAPSRFRLTSATMSQ